MNQKLSSDFLQALKMTAKVNFHDSKKRFEENMKNRRIFQDGKYPAKLIGLEPDVVNDKPILRPKWKFLEGDNVNFSIYGNTFWLHNDGGIAWFLNFLFQIGMDVDNIKSLDNDTIQDIIKEVVSQEIVCLVKVVNKPDSDFPDVKMIEKMDESNIQSAADNSEPVSEQEEEKKQEKEDPFENMSLKGFQNFCKTQKIKPSDTTKMIGKNYGDIDNTKSILSQYTFNGKKLSDEEKQFLELLELDSFIE